MTYTRRLSAVLAVAAVGAVGLLAAPAPAASRSSGANPGFAGNQADGATPRTCVVCHSSFALNSGTGGVTITAPASATPGETVRITVTVTNTTPAANGYANRQGFEATVRDRKDGAFWGTLVLTDVDDTQLVGTAGDWYVTHTTGGTAKTSWSFDWQVGSEEGVARIYVAANAANGVSTSGDYIYATTADVLVGSTAEEVRPEAAFDLGVPRPSPARAGARVRLDLSLRQSGRVRVRVVDGVGRDVRTVMDAVRPTGEGDVEVPTAGLAPGTYFVVVDGPGGRRVQPLTVVR